MPHFTECDLTSGATITYKIYAPKGHLFAPSGSTSGVYAIHISNSDTANLPEKEVFEFGKVPSLIEIRFDQYDNTANSPKTDILKALLFY